MKTTNSLKWVITGAAVLTASALLAIPASGRRHGTDILHLNLRTAMVNQGIESNAVGRVDLKRNQQGNADNQKLEISLKGLTANTSYELLALLGDDIVPTSVAAFTTDDDGEADLKYRDNGKAKSPGRGNGPGNNGNGNGNGNGHGRGNKHSLPPVLDPVSNIRELTVFNGTTQAVLTANLQLPEKLQYLVKRDLSTNNVDALLRIKATTEKADLRLVATGLNATNDYFLALNGVVVQTHTTDENGKLVISTPLDNPTNILELHSVAVWDGATNVVVSTDLP